MSSTLTMNCRFCGNVEMETDRDSPKDLTLDVPGCTRCSAQLTVGASVRYDSPERAPGDAVYADLHLERGKSYKVAKVKRHQHAAYFEFAETGTRQFITRLFVPVGFVKSEVSK